MRKQKKMKNLLVITFALIVSSIFTSFYTENETNEIIRRKIENQYIIPLMAENDLIYCVPSLSRIYENSMFSLAWENKNSIEQLIKSIELSENEGLNPKDYHIDKLLNLYSNYSKLTPEQIVNIDLLATDAFLLYTTHLLSGKVNPTSIDPEWYVKRREGDPVMLFEEAIKNNSVTLVIKEALPKHKTSEDERIILVKKRLLISNDLSEDDLGNIKQYDDKLYDALIIFQKRHNLEADGTIGKLTISVMNKSVDERIDQIEVNMERWRWLPQEFSNYYVKVNIANYYVEVFKDGELKKHYKAIVGKDYRRTPVFSSKITYLVLNPTWTVPPGIISADVIPAVKKDINYLKKKNLSVLDNKGNIIDPASVDWNNSIVKSYTYRQPPGPDNALGAVKFMFPNTFSVYLHDTPSKELFDKSERSFSSGCIRVQNPLQLAEFFLNDSIKWNSGKIKKQIESRNTLTIILKEQPDIHILYWTAWIDDNGIIQFRKDIYNRDPAISKSLKTENIQ